jgi:parallel beta helix pectate lyase-like protein
MKRHVAPRTRSVFIELLVAALIGAVCTLATSLPAGAAHSTTVALPTSIPSSCGSADSTTALEDFLASVPAYSTVLFPRDGCFVVNGTLLLQGITGLTIEGNGSTLDQTVSPATQAPIVELWDDTNLAIADLTISGNYDGSNGGEGYENDYGVQFEADTNVTLSHDTVRNIQGDFLYFSPPYDVATSDALSTGITITNSTFTNAGYHGLSVESVGCRTLEPCNGLTVRYDTFDGMGTDAMDFEYDDYSTPFNPDGTPYWVAQDDVTIKDNTWVNWSGDWFVSDQGQAPGVQQDNVSIIGNTLDGSGPLFEITGTATFDTTTPYLNIGLTIIGNKMINGNQAYPYRGAATVAISIYSVASLVMENNFFPLATTGAYVMDLYNITDGEVKNNVFTGGNPGGNPGIVLPQDYATWMSSFSECGNKYWNAAGKPVTDAVCTSH